MILTHGGNSVGRDNGNYIYDNFVALYNGVTDSGYAINDGSFGQLLWDANGPIQAPNGRGTPYYARANFSGQNGGVQAIYDEVKGIFAAGNWTVDFWYYRDSSIALDNQWLFSIGDMSSEQYSAYITIPTGYEAANKFNVLCINGFNNATTVGLSASGWMHIAFVSRQNDTSMIYINGGDENSGRKISCPAYIRGTDPSTIRFRFYGSAGGIRIAQFALRDYAVWTSDFTPPNLLYRQI